MKNLKDLSFSHPLCPPNPVCYLCNYSTHVLYHLPQLQWLDGREVGIPALQDLVQGLVLRKVQYYRMLLHHARTNTYHHKLNLQSELSTTLSTSLYPQLRALYLHKKMVHYSFYGAGSSNSLLVFLSWNWALRQIVTFRGYVSVSHLSNKTFGSKSSSGLK